MTAFRINGHRCEETINSWGFGFGYFEYRCPICEGLVRSVPVAEMNSEEASMVFGTWERFQKWLEAGR